MKTVEERINTLENLTGEDLLKLYDLMCDKFNPLDDYYCETYKLVRAEVLKRLELH